MYTYRVQLKKINYYQVDIVSDNPLTVAEIHAIAIRQANREFEDSDETEVDQIELVNSLDEPPSSREAL